MLNLMTQDAIPAKAVAARVPSPAARFARRALDLLLPPQCPGCNALTETPGTLCAECWAAMTFIGQPMCHACGLAFEFAALGEPEYWGEGGAERLYCASCIGKPPLFARARSVLAYDDASRPLVLALKHADRTETATGFAAWMVRAGTELIDEADLLAPVALHWTRLFARRYNQAALLSNAIAQISGVPCVPDLLLRTRKTPSQGTLSPSARRRNIRGAFALNQRRRAAVRGRRVLLIDDVMTTGATATAAARTLLDGGARAVDVLTLARVPRPLPP